MKKIILLVILSGIFLLNSCVKEDSEKDTSIINSSNNESSENSAANEKKTPTDLKITDNRINTLFCEILSDKSLLSYDENSSDNTVELIKVSLPDFKIEKEKTIAIKSSSLIDVRVDRETILVFSNEQAAGFDSDLNLIKSIDFPDNDYSDNIVNVNSDLSRLLYYDKEGLKIADTDFENAKLLFRHPKWNDNIVDSEAYMGGYFFDNDTKVFSYIDGRDSEGMLASTGLAVYDLKNDSVITKEYLMGWHGSNDIYVDNKGLKIVNLDYIDDNNSEYNLISFDCESRSFNEEKIVSIHNDKLIGTPTLSNTYVGINEQYFVYTCFDENNLPALCRYNLSSGKTDKRVFKAEDYDSDLEFLEFIPFYILPDGRVAIHYFDSDELFLVDF
jgi:hypothetical protein